jgi:uncharacterized protein YegJ (DUF2314 family)
MIPRPSILMLAGAAMLLCVETAAAQTILEKTERDEIIRVPKDDPPMAAAMRKARASLPEFFALAKQPKPSMTHFAIKVAIPHDNDGHEYFWVGAFENKGDHYTGQLRNTPRLVKGLKLGATIRFQDNAIVDWTYIGDGETKGNFTACALLLRETKEAAEAFMKRYRLNCDL